MRPLLPRRVFWRRTVTLAVSRRLEGQRAAQVNETKGNAVKRQVAVWITAGTMVLGGGVALASEGAPPGASPSLDTTTTVLGGTTSTTDPRSEEHTSELQSPMY